jgi:predicted DNA binding CopG/RHH family protein
MAERPSTRAIPEFPSRQQEAEFWDTHDTTDFEAAFKPVRARFARNLSEGVTIRFDKETLDELRARARAKGIGPSTLARMWVLEKLREEPRAAR